ncbi:MAG: hypothetical protein P8N52_06825 [Crocinitomicaceae bacterium]|nr:hypothetical protein [Crocinitomicaceae bacterium]MDG1777232.1 hypothetical protein [Crocinitomicaceae bacterium]
MIVSGEYIMKINFDGVIVPAGEYSGHLIDHICFEQVYALSKLKNTEIPEKRRNFRVEIIQRKIGPVDVTKENQPWTTYWVNNFKNDPQHGQKWFKRLKTGYSDFNIDKSLIDIVELEEFIKIEDQRIPIFVGTQFGIYPRIDQVPHFFNGEKLLAILGKSILSGCVSGLSLYQINRNDSKFTYNKIQTFRNTK